MQSFCTLRAHGTRQAWAALLGCAESCYGGERVRNPLGPQPWGSEALSVVGNQRSIHENGLHYEPVLESSKRWQPVPYPAPSAHCLLMCRRGRVRHKFKDLSLCSEALTVPTSRHTLPPSLTDSFFPVSPSGHGGLEQALNLGSGDWDARPGLTSL